MIQHVNLGNLDLMYFNIIQLIENTAMTCDTGRTIEDSPNTDGKLVHASLQHRQLAFKRTIELGFLRAEQVTFCRWHTTQGSTRGKLLLSNWSASGQDYDKGYSNVMRKE